jgi:hypothetical protein
MRAPVAIQTVTMPGAIHRGVHFAFRVWVPAVVATGLIGALLVAGAVAIAVSAIADHAWGTLVWVVVLAGVGSGFVGVVVTYVRRDRSNPPGFLLTPAAVIAVQGNHVVIPWDVVTGVSIRSVRGVPRLGASRRAGPKWILVTVSSLDGVEGLDPRAARMAGRFGDLVAAGVAESVVESGAPVLHDTIDYYLEFPQARHELSNESAVRRIAALDFDDPPYGPGAGTNGRAAGGSENGRDRTEDCIEPHD